jgi:hypothetical protein
MTVREAIDELTEKRHGTAEFFVDEYGDPVHVETVFTVQMDAGEEPESFFARLKQSILHPGDRIQLPANGGKYSFARIIRPAK